ncbi:MAG TPA: hypothetical protein DCX54_08810 [Flavobacteriales bacterium]|nr:hypothetical protein [Flavobacteriales bacterium]
MEDVVKKRVLLAKEFHLNGIELARKCDPLSKMMAVHNFHIGIEIIVKSILLKFEIRNEKTLNIDFESMLNAVDSHQEFKDKKLRLPYRQEIRNLNQVRNLVQHHVMEPDQSSMDDWRLFSSRFITQTLKEYFDIDFEKINRISFVSDSCLRKYLNTAIEYINKNKYDSASCLAAAAFEYASISISSFIPDSSASFFVSSALWRSELDFDVLKKAFNDTFKRIDESEHFAALLASGINLSDYKRYKDATPFVTIMLGGNPHFESNGQKEFTKESSTWLVEFVTASLVKWQQYALDPKVPEYLFSAADSFIESEISNQKFIEKGSDLYP